MIKAQKVYQRNNPFNSAQSYDNLADLIRESIRVPENLLGVEMLPFDAEILSVQNIGASQAEQRGDEIINEKDDDEREDQEQQFQKLENKYLDPKLAIKERAKQTDGGQNRMLKFVMTNGQTKFVGIEFRRFQKIKEIKVGEKYKILPGAIQGQKLQLRNGIFLFQEANLILKDQKNIGQNNINNQFDKINRIQPNLNQNQAMDKFVKSYNQNCFNIGKNPTASSSQNNYNLQSGKNQQDLSKISFSSEFGFGKGFKGTINNKNQKETKLQIQEEQSEEYDVEDLLDILD